MPEHIARDWFRKKVWLPARAAAGPGLAPRRDLPAQQVVASAAHAVQRLDGHLIAIRPTALVNDSSAPHTGLEFLTKAHLRLIGSETPAEDPAPQTSNA
ncbi:hypothetical protein [Thermomonospora echinospora]|uniref:hypothetical protein n=1 Tax=Thermomonospora echinospora TaxID=1992 RepID=UPI0011B00ACF|nr:hypothetical protein [Thermomonospora echinospora]